MCCTGYQGMFYDRQTELCFDGLLLNRVSRIVGCGDRALSPVDGMTTTHDLARLARQRVLGWKEDQDRRESGRELRRLDDEERLRTQILEI